MNSKIDYDKIAKTYSVQRNASKRIGKIQKQSLFGNQANFSGLL